MTRCPQGHFYDPSKHTACPWCALPADQGVEQKTRPVRDAVPPPLPGAQAAVPPPPPLAQSSVAQASVAQASIAPPNIPPPSPPPNATVRVGAEARAGLKRDPVVGWLVCLEGPDRGRDYRLHAEKNFIGRSPLMDVVIESDNTVSRERHAIVIFDPKKKSFWALPGEASGLVYLNSEIVNTPTPMKDGDALEVGQTKLVLVPFCGERFDWSQESAAGI